MRKYCMLLVAMLGGAYVFADTHEYGEPGFRMFAFTGSAYNGTSSLWGNGNVLRTIYPEKLYIAQGTEVPEHTTYAYGTYMFMEGGVTYTFYAYYDDYATVKVDDSFVVGKPGSECQNQTGTVRFDTDGWHKLEMRVSNNGGNGGSLNGIGIQYSTSADATRKTMTDHGTGRLFRVGPEPATFTEYLGYAKSGTMIFVDSISMRANDPTVLDVEYYGVSSRDKVSLRMIAFKDGTRSLANVVRPETFVDGTETNLGDNVSIKGYRKISWRVSSDWEVDLAKVSVEFLVKPEESLVPLKFTTIPAVGDKKAMKVSVAAPTNGQVFNALLWLYAINDPDFSLSSGQMFYVPEAKLIAIDSSPIMWVYKNSYWGRYSTLDGDRYGDWYDDPSYSYGTPAMVAVEAVYNKLGYQYLGGEALDYAKRATRKSYYVNTDGDEWYWNSDGCAYKWLDK